MAYALEHIQFITRLADDALIQGQRLSEWCGHGPILEEDIALTNLALDCIGQSRAFYSLASTIEAKGRSEDDFAFFRNEEAFQNHLILELPKGDFGFTIMRQFLFGCFNLIRMEELSSQNQDQEIAAIATKSKKELRYHLEHSADWVKRLGDGSAESHNRISQSLEQLWPYTGEMFTADQVDFWAVEQGLIPNQADWESAWMERVTAVLSEATLDVPQRGGWMHSGGKSGRHTEHLGYLLAEMQSLARKHPGVTW